MSGHFNWSSSASVEKYGWGIVHTAKWCHYRKGELCTVPFPKGEICTIDNCPMRPQDFADMFPEDFVALANERDALRERCDAFEWLREVKSLSQSWLLNRLEASRLVAMRSFSEQGDFIMGALDELDAIKKTALSATEVK